MGEGNEGGADKADAAKGAKEKEKSVMDQPKEPDEKPKTAPDEGKPTTPPVKATESEPAKADQSPAVLNKNPDPKEKQRIVVFKVTQEKKPVWSEIKIQNPSNDQKTFKVC
ncbi:hypothetical protein TELCIR_09352 [Teladorsagia circumcincta]|uniref:Major sperm protein n=1 Tax=Teladorsagia circumcincta TaxID=45464 RepID=A0A2G9UF82_TELCI|nr:hypothetical protein TELCIR_09352 [Teladorsagia circumcincta]